MLGLNSEQIWLIFPLYKPFHLPNISKEIKQPKCYELIFRQSTESKILKLTEMR